MELMVEIPKLYLFQLQEKNIIYLRLSQRVNRGCFKRGSRKVAEAQRIIHFFFE
jgi:hypothetical protein